MLRQEISELMQILLILNDPLLKIFNRSLELEVETLHDADLLL